MRICRQCRCFGKADFFLIFFTLTFCCKGACDSREHIAASRRRKRTASACVYVILLTPFLCCHGYGILSYTAGLVFFGCPSGASCRVTLAFCNGHVQQPCKLSYMRR